MLYMERFSKNINRKPKTRNKQGGVTPEFKKLVKDFMDEHNDVLKELTKR